MNSNKGFIMLMLGLMLCCPLLLSAQTYGNEWIQYDQQYLKLKVGENGIYKLGYQELVQAGIPVDQINPKTLQLFHRGQEQAIHVQGEGDEALNPEDFLLFWGRKNDGTLDKELYLSAELQPHNYYNLYSDTTAYFLTFKQNGPEGKRMPLYQETNSSGASAEPYYIDEKLYLYTSSYSTGVTYGFEGNLRTYSSYGDKGEGWTGGRMAGVRNYDFILSGLSDAYTAGPAPELSVQLNGLNNLTRNIPIQVGPTTTALTEVHKASFTGLVPYTFQENLNWSALGVSQAVVRISTIESDRATTSYIKLRYARRWNMANQSEREFRLPASAAGRYTEITNVPANAMLFDITDPHQVKQISITRTGSTVQAMLPPSNVEQVLTLTTAPKLVSTKKIVAFRKLPDSGANYIIISHSRLMKQGGGYDNPVQEYANYRASVQGGGHSTLLVDIQELYDQFSWGEYSPTAIRRFVLYASQNELPKYLFLIGKALHVQQRYYRTANWVLPGHDLVPTFGFPGADIPYVSQLNGSGFAPAIPIGRLSVNTPAEVAAYFNKVKEDEGTAEKSLWVKRLVHLGGGTTAAEARTFRYLLSTYEDMAEDIYLGGKVKTISKTEDVVVQEINISAEVNNGARLITFFGHSSPSLTDIEIGFVSDPRTGYNNKGKYPRLLVNGCDAGNIFSPNLITFGEDWIFTPDKGAINFIAHSGTGYTSTLHNYSSLFYYVSVKDPNFLGASIGKIQMETARRLLENGGQDLVKIAQANQMVLQGDPAAVLYPIKQSDFETNNDHVNVRGLNGQQLNISADSIAVNVIARNFGKAVEDTLLVQLEYWLEGASPRVLKALEIPAVYYSDTLQIHLGTNELAGAGLSNFRVTLNPGSVLPESDYTNNTGSVQLLIPAGGTLNVLPYNYAVVSKDQVGLISQGTNLLYPSRGYSLQLDTAANFSSTALQKNQIQAKTLVNWSVTLHEAKASPTDTVVYFWNSRLAIPEATEDPTAAKSSFTYLPNGPEGWAQAHEGQFNENTLSKLEVNEGRSWKFTPLTKDIRITTFGSAAPGTSYKEVEVRVDEVQYILKTYNFCNDNSINALHFDQNTLELMIAKPYGLQFSESCGILPQFINNFIATNVINGNNDDYNLERYLNGIPQGDWIVLFSIGTNNYTQWPASVKAQVQTLGVNAATLSQLASGEPLILVGRKGAAAGSATVIQADKSAGSLPPNQQLIQLTTTIEGTPGVGFIESPLIGPAANWQDIAVQIKEDDTDSWKLSVIGVGQQQQETTLLELEQSGTQPLTADAAVYPYIRLKLQVNDPVKQTPPQLRFWRIGFEPMPEGVLLAGDTLKPIIKVYEGQSVKPGFKFVNVSEKSYKADSLEVRSSMLNVTRRSTQANAFKIKSPAPGDTIRFGIPLATEKKGGLNDLSVKVNPYPFTEVTLQNNTFDKRGFIEVSGDSLHPFIDVAFDGSYITNGEIVRPDPMISVVLRDENKFRLKQDTTGVHVYLKRQCEECKFERVNLNSSTVRFYPATQQESFKVEFTPGPLTDGIYTLQVQAEDASGNKAGTKPYTISFEVITESTITNFYPYPNPFSTSTRFVFTLTGNEVPDDLKIQIMTVSGKVVKEIMKEDLGLHIGNNISPYAWDGTDEWGDRLANGVYLYRVVMGGSNASQWKHRATKGDKAFKQEFGKLYILR